jgi:hypothetical protein
MASGVSMSAKVMSIGPVLRLLVPIQSLDLMAGFGFPVYLKTSQKFSYSGASESVSWSYWGNYKLSFGALFRATDRLRVGGTFDYLITANGKGEGCYTPAGGEETCSSDGMGDIQDVGQLNFVLSYVFGG